MSEDHRPCGLRVGLLEDIAVVLSAEPARVFSAIFDAFNRHRYRAGASTSELIQLLQTQADASGSSFEVLAKFCSSASQTSHSLQSLTRNPSLRPALLLRKILLLWPSVSDPTLLVRSRTDPNKAAPVNPSLMLAVSSRTIIISSRRCYAASTQPLLRLEEQRSCAHQPRSKLSTPCVPSAGRENDLSVFVHIETDCCLNERWSVFGLARRMNSMRVSERQRILTNEASFVCILSVLF